MPERCILGEIMRISSWDLTYQPPRKEWAALLHMCMHVRTSCVAFFTPVCLNLTLKERLCLSWSFLDILVCLSWSFLDILVFLSWSFLDILVCLSWSFLDILVCLSWSFLDILVCLSWLVCEKPCLSVSFGSWSVYFNRFVKKIVCMSILIGFWTYLSVCLNHLWTYSSVCPNCLWVYFACLSSSVFEHACPFVRLIGSYILTYIHTAILLPSLLDWDFGVGNHSHGQLPTRPWTQTWTKLWSGLRP